MAKHREPGEEPVEGGGISPRILILTVVALVVFTLGVVWAAVERPRAASAPPASGGAALIEPGQASGAASPAGSGGVESPTAVAPRGTNVWSASSSRPAPLPSPTSPSRAAGRPAASATGALTVTAATRSWQGWYSAYYTITNGTSATVDSWTVVLTFSSKVTSIHAWDVAPPRVTGTKVTLAGLSYNSVIEPGHTASFGVQASSGEDATPVPVSCTINGQPCSG